MDHNQYHREYQRRRYTERLEACLSALGGVCTICESAEELEFHHVDQSTKLHDVTYMLSKYSQTKIDEELAKCVLLCKDHHAGETAHQNSVEHGGGLTGKKKNCMCELCEPLKKAYMREYMPKYRARRRGQTDTASTS